MWQPKLGKNKPKFHRFQFCKSYGDICVYGRFFGVGKFKCANKNFSGAEGVAMASKFTQKDQNRFQFCMQYSPDFYIYDRVSGL